MADDQFQQGSGKWWDTSKNRFDDSRAPPPAPMIASTSLDAISSSFRWPTEMADTNTSESAGAASHGGRSAGGDPNMQIMGLGLSSQPMDWNQAALFSSRDEKAEGSYRSMLEEDMSSNTSNFQGESSSHQQHFITPKNDFKQINRGGQPQFIDDEARSNEDSTQNSTAGLLLPENQHHHCTYGYESLQPIMSYAYPYSSAELVPSWNKFLSTTTHLHFTNTTPNFWNASTHDHAAPSTYPQPQILSPPSFDQKPKKKSSTETSNKRSRGETPSPLPAFKVRKEKMGDRITALQQLVSPFGKTDTASVLSEAIEYIKFLHEHVGALSAPYMKNGAPTLHLQVLQKSEKSMDSEGPRQDLRSRGLCLVPVSSTFPLTQETTVDFWTPTTFGASFR